MSVFHRRRSLIAWILYACVLFSALTCSLNHGQQTGLELNGVGGLFCSVDNSTGDEVNNGAGGSRSTSLMPGMGCPLCSTVALSIAALLCLSWLLHPSGKKFAITERRVDTSPRLIWPPANPRAP
ncbi:DUF2946 domain-containing protein [Pseudomonas sp. REP124]|uniref:DUF2946 domain-containing protein n=1 Tax=Pseudomonas sp. REP124 TaxID=2875731 RepID=UPI001CCE5268|nr:DUF2946 domain-containing protein [Pseudomonas sp. REP124]MBZ9783769.1 DUF2946 domain-containing protein [Pseudomonas sp. REP124]